MSAFRRLLGTPFLMVAIFAHAVSIVLSILMRTVGNELAVRDTLGVLTNLQVLVRSPFDLLDTEEWLGCCLRAFIFTSHCDCIALVY